MTATASALLTKARDGDGEAFRALVGPHERELRVHCYRMLGSLQDAEDALQETLLSAWRGLAGFEERSSLRTWLYRIATTRCLNARRAAGRRAGKEWDIPGVEPLEPTRLGEVVWLQPFPDSLLDGGEADAAWPDARPGPEARAESTEAMSLAFVTALQLLPPRQVAVLILRDVLGFAAAEVAEMLDSTVDSVTSALKRARAGLARNREGDASRPAAPTSGTPAEKSLVSRFVTAYEAADLDAVLALLTDDAFMSMPPMSFEYAGREEVGRFLGTLFGAGRRWELVPTRANGQPAFGMYRRADDGTRHGVGFLVLTLAGNRVSALTRFENTLLPWFGLPRSIPPA